MLQHVPCPDVRNEYGAWTLKDAIKALNVTFSGSSVPLPLPEQLQTSIETFLDKHTNLDDHDSQRLQEELLTVFHKHVASSNEKHAPFIRTLRQFRPAITGQARLLEWWELIIRPSIDTVGQKKKVNEEAKEFLLSILVYDVEDKDREEKSKLSDEFLTVLLNIYLDRARMPTADGITTSPEDEYIARDLESLFVAFGRKKPKDFLIALDNLVLPKVSRLRALSLLCTFVRYQPPHLYLVQETTLIENLLKCLMIDTSTTAISLALTTLIMFLPHIPTSLVAHLPRLFLIYSRLLCWDMFVLSPEEHQRQDGKENGRDEETDELQSAAVTPAWDQLEQALDDAESTAPELLHYFTFLYGLYPLNFMSYIRKPRKYLKSIDFPGADDFDLNQSLIRDQTEQFRQVHLMHPGFYTTTVEDELTDNRWIKADPSDVVMECMGLCAAVPTGLSDPGPPPRSKLPDLPGRLLRTEDIPTQTLTARGGESPAVSSGLLFPGDSRTQGSWRDTQSTAITSQSSYATVESPSASRKDSEVLHSLSPTAGSSISSSRDYFDSPTLGPQDSAPPSAKPPPTQASAASSTAARKPIERSKESSPRLDAFAHSVGSKRGSPPTSPVGNPASMAYLQREVMLIRNDLNFERYLKQQHLAHIGHLQRKTIRDATTEAETQTLLNSNRTLKAKLAKAHEANAALQKENATGRTQSKKWEGELSSKVRSLRDDQKAWQNTEESLRHDLARSHADIASLRALIIDAESRDLLAQQRLRATESDLAELEALRQQVAALREALRAAEAQELAFEAAKAEQEITRTELDTANLRLQAREAERVRSRQAYERKIAELESRLRAAENPMPREEGGRASPARVVQVLEEELRESQMKLGQLKKAHARLLHRYTELEMRVQELEGGEVEDFQQRKGSEAHDFGLTAMSARRSSAGGSLGHGSGSVSGSAGGYSTLPRPSRPHGPSDALTGPEDDDYVINLDPYNSPPSRAMTFGSVASQGRSATVRSPETELGQARITGGDAGAKNPSVSASEQEGGRSVTSPTWEGEVVQSSSKSAWSAGSDGSKSEKGKIQPKSEIRIYGRGGAQNIDEILGEIPKSQRGGPCAGGFWRDQGYKKMEARTERWHFVHVSTTQSDHDLWKTVPKARSGIAMSKQSKSVVFLHPDLGIGGAERLVIDAAVGLQNRGHKVTIFTSHCDPKHCFDEARDGTLDVRVRGNTVIPPSLFSRLSILCAILRQLHLVLSIAVFTNELTSLKPTYFLVDQLSACIPLLRLLAPRKTRILFYCHFPDKLLVREEKGDGGWAVRLLQWGKKRYRVPFDWVEEWSTGSADGIVVNSRFTRGVFKQAFPGLKERVPGVVYPCVDTESKTTSEKAMSGGERLWQGKKVVLSINRFERKKDVGLAVKAYAGLKSKEREGTRLVVAGGYDPRISENVSYHKELVALAESFDLRTATARNAVSALSIPSDIDVLFLLSVPNQLKSTLLSAARLLLYTPQNEHFGIVPLEAMLAGLPVLAANSGGPTETVVDGKTGWLRNADQLDEWTDIIEQVLSGRSDKRLRAMGHEGAERVTKAFSQDTMAQTIDDELEKLRNAERPSVPIPGLIYILAVFGAVAAVLLCTTRRLRRVQLPPSHLRRHASTRQLQLLNIASYKMADNSIIEIDMVDADTGQPISFNTAQQTSNNLPESVSEARSRSCAPVLANDLCKTVTALEPEGFVNESAPPTAHVPVPIAPALEPEGSINELAPPTTYDNAPVAPAPEPEGSASGPALAADNVHVPNIIPASNHEDPDEMSFVEAQPTEVKVGTTQITRENGAEVRHVGFALQDDCRMLWYKRAPFFAGWTGEAATLPTAPRQLNPQTPANPILRPGYSTPLFNKDATLVQDLYQSTPEDKVILTVPMQMDLNELVQTPMELYGRESIEPALIYRTAWSHDSSHLDNFTARFGAGASRRKRYRDVSVPQTEVREQDIATTNVNRTPRRRISTRRDRFYQTSRAGSSTPTPNSLQSRKRKRSDDDDGIHIRRTITNVYDQAVASVQPLIDRALLVKRGIVAAVRFMSRIPRGVRLTAEWVGYPAVYTYRALKRRRIENTAPSTQGQEGISTTAALNAQESTLPQLSESTSSNNLPATPEKKTEAQRHENLLHDDPYNPSPAEVKRFMDTIRRRKGTHPVQQAVRYHLAVRKELESTPAGWPKKFFNLNRIKKEFSSKKLSTDEQRFKNALDGFRNRINTAEGRAHFLSILEKETGQRTRDKEQVVSKKTDKVSYQAYKAEMAKVRTMKAKFALPPEYERYYYEEVPHVYQSEFEDELADEPNPDQQLRRELQAEVAKATASAEHGRKEDSVAKGAEEVRVVPAPITLAPPVEQTPQPAPGKDDAIEQSLPPASSLRPLQLDPRGPAHFAGEERSAEPPTVIPGADAEESVPERPSSQASIKEEPLAELNELADSLDQPAPQETPAPVAAPELVASLTDDQTRKLAEAIGNSNPGATVGPGVTRKDIGTIVPHHSFDRASGWLNDVAVETFLQHVVAEATDRLAASTDDGNATDASTTTGGPRGRRTRAQTPDPTPRYHAFNPAFMKSVAERGAGAVSRWARRAKMGGDKLLRVRTIFFPVNLSGAHWSLLLVHPRERRIQSLDSLAPGGDRRAVRLALDWLRQELGRAFVEEEWEVLGGASTQQTNGRDCGVFTCFNALAAARGAPPAVVKAEEMGRAREMMVVALVEGGLGGL
ncbi:MAG: hypothetical protein Q9165_007792 [Trypethelium subeluteriae]